MKGNGGQWRGRYEKISELEAEIVRLKKMSESIEQNRSNKMFDSQLSSPEEVGQLQARDNGDGSSRQESLSRQDDNDASTVMFLATLKSSASSAATPTAASVNVRELQSKLHEYKIICQVQMFTFAQFMMRVGVESWTLRVYWPSVSLSVHVIS